MQIGPMRRQLNQGAFLFQHLAVSRTPTTKSSPDPPTGLLIEHTFILDIGSDVLLTWDGLLDVCLGTFDLASAISMTAHLSRDATPIADYSDRFSSVAALVDVHLPRYDTAEVVVSARTPVPATGLEVQVASW